MRLLWGVKRGPTDLRWAGIQSDAAHGTRPLLFMWPNDADIVLARMEFGITKTARRTLITNVIQG
jgi:hypothetical protein